QALILMNGPLALAQSRALAERLLAGGGDKAEMIKRAYEIALGRPPGPAEIAASREFLRDQAQLARERLRARLPVYVPPGAPTGIAPEAAAALADFCLAIVNLNEFVYVDC